MDSLDKCSQATPSPLISVLIPTYNNTNYLGETIQSVLNQDYKNYEIIVVDDGSTDDTQALLARPEYAPHITVITQSNKGVSSARNIAIEAAHGKYVALLDADDRWLPNRLSAVLDMLPSYDLITAEYRYINENGQQLPTPIEPGGVVDYHNLLYYKMYGPTSIWRLETIKTHRYDITLNFAEDYDTQVHALKAGARWGHSNKVLVEYRQHPHSLCHTYKYDIAKTLWRIYSKHITDDGYWWAFKRYRHHLARYRWSMLAKAIRTRRLPIILKCALLSLLSPFYLPTALSRLSSYRSVPAHKFQS